MDKELNLVDLLQRRLIIYGYSVLDQGVSLGEDLQCLAILGTARRLMVRRICIICTVPTYVRSYDDMRQYLSNLRRGISKLYARFPWWKEIGSFFVIFCEPLQFEAVRGRAYSFTDKTGLHMNVVLGVSFVDQVSHEFESASSWGMSPSTSKPYGSLVAALAEFREAH